MATDALLTSEQVADRLRVSPRTVRRYVALGLVRGIHIAAKGARVGSSPLLIPAVDVDALIAQSLSPAKAPAAP